MRWLGAREVCRTFAACGPLGQLGQRWRQLAWWPPRRTARVDPVALLVARSADADGVGSDAFTSGRRARVPSSSRALSGGGERDGPSRRCGGARGAAPVGSAGQEHVTASLSYTYHAFVLGGVLGLDASPVQGRSGAWGPTPTGSNPVGGESRTTVGTFSLKRICRSGAGVPRVRRRCSCSRIRSSDARTHAARST